MSRDRPGHWIDINLFNEGVQRALGLDDFAFRLSIENLYRLRLLAEGVKYETRFG